MIDLSGRASIPTDAINLYIGNFYRPLDKPFIQSQINAGQLRLFIISAGYGLVDANEKICDYNKTMTGSTARRWRDLGLVDIISEVIISLNPSRAFGFFSGYSHWGYPGSKYRYFFTEGLKNALVRGYDPEDAGCFYRAAGAGQTLIPTTLGKCFMDAMQADFSKTFLERMKNNDRPYSQGLPITIKYESFTRRM